MMRRAPLLLLLVILLAGSFALAQTAAPIERSVPARLAPKSLLLDIVRAGDALVAVGERGHILISRDNGATWQQADVPTRSTLTGVAFQSPQVGVAVGHDAVIVRTTDGGATWKRVHWAPEDEAPLLDVIFLGGNRGLAIGAYGSSLLTTDGGATWQDSPVSDDDRHLNQIAGSVAGGLYIAAESGNVYRSDDGGTSWTALTTQYEGSFFGVLPLENDAVLLFGLRGHLYRSEDRGASWTPVETGTVAMLNSGVRLPDGRIVIVGLGGVVLVSDDGGRTFTLWQQETRAGIQALVDAGGGRLILVGEGGARPLPLNELRKDR